jgi:hypothetical protein
MKKMWIALSIALGIASSGMAQDVVMRTQDPAARQAAEKIAAAQREQKVVGEVRARMAVEARITTGAPYSAEAVTESTQALADGNRINRKSTTRVYRDGEGRTRREEVDEAGTVVSVSIVDPVAHVSYVLDPATRTAYRKNAVIEMPPMEMRQKIEMATAKERTAVPPPPPPPPPAAGAIRQAPPPPPPAPGARLAAERIAAGSVAREDLGQQNIEGVTATGTRTTNTIAAGAIGNLQPIKVVSEQWFSPDLQLLVMTRHSDPRAGETVYRLQGIVRAEPDRSLFTLPADYTLKESGIRQPQ